MHPEVRAAIDRLTERESVAGIDPFGFRPAALEQILPPAHFLYRRWFRVSTYDIDRVPEGRVLLISNHSGQLPFDGAMIATAMILDHNPPRVPRGMVERYVPTVPFISTLFSRGGQVVGTRANAERMLAEGNAVLVFPEGTGGISKTIFQRYQLQKFGLGFMRLALETDTPIVPIAVVGAEEQIPSVYNARHIGRMLGAPALPVSPTLVFPLPVKYRIYFGEPMRFSGDPDDEDRAIAAQVREVTSAIEGMIARGLAERDGLFG
ncbi:MAG: acyltransferase family protein [Myxococcales bacterium]|nr:acyltransferase family protein [Myxococcales bacterium]MCB9531568.1 acyltransferase family protein [Myxococcales bacterium]MCB9532781.1 acyltransferase family protein [Myxococcales bacterium]